MVASDRISIYDVVMPTPIPDKGKVLNRMSDFWFELTGDIVPNHFISERRAGGGRRTGRCGCGRLEMYPVECVVRGYLSGSGWKEYRECGAVCGIELPAGPARVRQAAGADLHPGDQGRDRRPRRERRLRAGRRDRRRPGADGGAAADLDRGLPARRRARGRARDHPRRHQVRVRPPRRRRDRPRRRGPDPRLLALLAGRPLRARPHAALLRQAVRARLGRRGGLGPHAAGAGAAARRGRADPRPSTSRPTSGSRSARF